MASKVEIRNHLLARFEEERRQLLEIKDQFLQRVAEFEMTYGITLDGQVIPDEELSKRQSKQRRRRKRTIVDSPNTADQKSKEDTSDAPTDTPSVN